MSTNITTEESGNTEQQEQVEGQAPEVEAEVAEEPEVPAETGAEEIPAEEITEEVPVDVLRSKLTEANAEAANYRTKLRLAEESLKNAKTPEEYDAGIAEITEVHTGTVRSLTLENVALKFDLPDELAGLLKGDTREELEAHAVQLAKYAPVEPEVTPRGGLRPNSDEGQFDAKAQWQKNRRRR